MEAKKNVKEHSVLESKKSIKDDMTFNTSNRLENTNEKNLKTSSKLNFWKGINDVLNSLFHYDLRNVLKLINYCLIALVGINTAMFYQNLKYSQFRFTLKPLLMLGFVILIIIFLFMFNM
jgi:hypothetical protein